MKKSLLILLLISIAAACSAVSFSVDVLITNGVILVSTTDPLEDITGVWYSIDTNKDGSFVDEDSHPYSEAIVINKLDLMAGNYAVQGGATNQTGDMVTDTNNFDHVRLTMPPVVYAVEGQETAIYFSNIMNSTTTDVSSFNVTITSSTVNAATDAERWYLTPTSENIGNHTMSVSVRDSNGRLLATVTNQLHIASAYSGNNEDVTLLIIGDSLTSAGQYPLQLATLLNTPGNPSWEMQGLNSKNGSNAYHEGYGGNTWKRFIEGYPTAPTYSPFFYSSPTPGLDFQRYLNENENGKKPDFITVNLGINDNFHASTNSLASIDISIDTMFTYATILLDEFRSVCPDAEIGIGITTPANARPSAFANNYGDANLIWKWKHIQRRLNERIIAKYRDRENENIYLIPSHLNLDNMDGFPVSNALHPNDTGYNQMGDSFYAWLKWRLEERESDIYNLPFYETFESDPPGMASTTGSVNGQHGWFAFPAENALVQGDDVGDGSLAVAVNHATMRHTFNDNQTNIWATFKWKPVLSSPPTSLPADATAIFWGNIDGTFSAYSNTTIVTSSQTIIETNIWSCITVHSDYKQQTWSLWHNDIKIFSNCEFYSTSLNEFKEIRFSSPTDKAKSRLDDIHIDTIKRKFTGSLCIIM